MAFKLAPFSKAVYDVKFKPDRPPETHARRYFIALAVAIAFLTLIARLFQLTIVKGAYYRYLAENNRLREYALDGPRGVIFDRKGIVLARSGSERDKDGNVRRYYTQGPALAHVIGYRQKASKNSLKHDACPHPLKSNDKIGAKGVEYVFECHLRPTKGMKLVETNAQGKEIRAISQVEPKPGNDLKLSIDSELQTKTLEAIQGDTIKSPTLTTYSDRKIAVVALKPQTGEVLELFSYPTYDPQDFEDGSATVTSYLTAPDKPLFDRALLGTYPPGSVFKPIVAVGALETGAITEDETIVDNGFLKAGPLTFNNWYYAQYGRTEGAVDLRKAIRRSNDIYFYTIGAKLTPKGIQDWAHKFGLGRKSGIQLDDAIGHIPTEFWKKEVLGERWYLGDTYNLSIGQGYMLVTPLQIAQETSVIANQGKLCRPTILKVGAAENKEIDGSDSSHCSDLNISKKTLTAVREGMHQACLSGGTGWPFFDFRAGQVDPNASESAKPRIEVGCKTGTAESQSKDHAPHAWFTVFAPFDNPEIVLTVLVENSGEGSNVAAPLAKEILRQYFERTD